MSDLHPTTRQLLRWFDYDHLPEPMRSTSRPFSVLAHALAGVPEYEIADLTEASELSTMFASLIGQHTGPELTVALRKLLEAKDAAVRACIAQQDLQAARPPRPGRPGGPTQVG